MAFYLISLLSAFLVTYLIIRHENTHSKFTADIDFSSPQTIHSKITPRIGGIGIMLGVTTSLLTRYSVGDNLFFLLFCLSITPIFLIGLMEDITKSISVKNRLILTGLCALLAVNLLGLDIDTVDIAILDRLLKFSFIAISFSVFAIVGLTNSYNIIDGLNGLSSMVACITLLGISYVSYASGDTVALSIALTFVFAILGFFPWNFPKGAIFLGDGGAYLLGFAISAICITLIKNNLAISPWFAVSVNAYPIIETLFSIYRRKFHKRTGPGQPDALHLHSLFYRRVVRGNEVYSSTKNNHLKNSSTSPYLWGISLMGVLPSLVFYKNSFALILILAIFISTYIYIYIKVVKFKTPKWLINNIY